MPRFNSIRTDKKTDAAQFGAQCMGLPGDDFWRRVHRLLQIDVAAGMALLLRTHTGIALDRNGKARIRLDVPHRIDEIASILGTQFDSELSAQFARRQRLRFRARPKIGEPDLDGGLAAKAQHRSRARTVDLKSPIRTRPDFAIGHTDVKDYLRRAADAFCESSKKNTNQDGLRKDARGQMEKAASELQGWSCSSPDEQLK